MSQQIPEDNSKKERTLGEYLFKDKRKYKKRLQLAVFPCTAFFFTFFFFGPIELFLVNYEQLRFGIGTMILTMVIPFILLSLSSSLILSLIKGRSFNFILGLILGVTVAGYIQCNMMNQSYSARMTGDTPDWKAFTLENTLTLMVWIAVIAFISFIIIKFRRHYYRYITMYTALFLIIIQLVGGASLLVKYQPDNRNTALLKKGEFEYSTEKNTLVFLLDRFDYEYVEAVIKDDPTFFDNLDGFTSYTNCVSLYTRTQPGANALLTAATTDAYLKPVNQYYDDSWTDKCGKSILDAIDETGYSGAIYGDYYDYFSNPEQAAVLSNSGTVNDIQINHLMLFLKFMKASAYRYVPGFLKPKFLYSTNNLTNGVILSLGGAYMLDDSIFFEDMKVGFTAVPENKPTFKFYHLDGSHSPYILDENGSVSNTPTDVVRQTKGVFTILNALFDKMKEVGIYNSTEIIITADHGVVLDEFDPLTQPSCIALFYKPSGATGRLKYSNSPVSQENIPPTILKGIGYKNYSDFGTPLDETIESDNTVRYFYKSVCTKQSTIESTVYKYKIEGDAKDFDNWEIIEIYNVTDPFYK